MKKYFDPQAVDFFRNFTLENSKGESLFEFKLRAYSVNVGIDQAKAKRQAMKDPKSPERKARVAQLAALYSVLELTEESPFDME